MSWIASGTQCRLLSRKERFLGVAEGIDGTDETTMGSSCDCHSAVCRVTVREVRVNDTGSASEHALAAKTTSNSRECHRCGEQGHIARGFWRSRNLNGRNPGKQNSRACYSFGKAGLIARSCRTVRKSHGSKYPDTAILTIPSALLTVLQGSKSSLWMMDSACTKHNCNEKSYFSTFTEDEGEV